MTRAELREAMARAICPYLCPPGHDHWEQWLDSADAALAAALPVLREHYAKMVDDAYYVGTMPYALVSSAIRADEGPK